MNGFNPRRSKSSPPPWFKTTDGHRLYARLIRPDDWPRLLDLFHHLSPETRRRRFHMNVDYLTDAQKRLYAQQLAAVDNRTLGGAVVAVDPSAPDEPIVAVARLARSNGLPEDPTAEIALVVRDDFQRRGVGRALVARLGPLARRMRLRQLIATIDADNLPALRLWYRLGVTTTTKTSHGETELHIILPK